MVVLELRPCVIIITIIIITFVFPPERGKVAEENARTVA